MASGWSYRSTYQRSIDTLEASKRDLVRLEREYEKAAAETADTWNAKSKGASIMPAGSDFYNVDWRVNAGRSGRYTIRVGWISPSPPMAADGKTSYYVYHDVGFRLFGNPNRVVEGVGAFLDAREELRARVADINRRALRRIGSRS